MELSYNIANWQNNVADDSEKNVLNFNENLINSILEVSVQLARLREEWKRAQCSSSESTSETILSSMEYSIKLWGWELPVRIKGRAVTHA